MGLMLMIEYDNIYVMEWWVDGGYKIHPDIKYHTDSMTNIVNGYAYE